MAQMYQRRFLMVRPAVEALAMPPSTMLMSSSAGAAATSIGLATLPPDLPTLARASRPSQRRGKLARTRLPRRPPRGNPGHFGAALAPAELVPAPGEFAGDAREVLVHGDAGAARVAGLDGGVDRAVIL